MFLIQQWQMSSGPHGPIFFSTEIIIFISHKQESTTPEGLKLKNYYISFYLCY